MTYTTWKPNHCTLVYISKETQRTAVLVDRSARVNPRFSVTLLSAENENDTQVVRETIFVSEHAAAFNRARNYASRGVHSYEST